MNLPKIRNKFQTFLGFLSLSLLFLGLAASVILVTERQEIREEAVECQTLWWWNNEDPQNCGQRTFCGEYMYYGLQTSETKPAWCGAPPPTTPSPKPTPTVPPIECQTLWWWDNEHPKNCSQKEFCGEYMYYGLQTSKTKPEWCKPSPSLTPAPSPTPTPLPESCNSECISRGFTSGYCDTAPVYPGESLCQSGETNIGWAQDCFVPSGQLGVNKGCCCVPFFVTPTPSPTPRPTAIPTATPTCWLTGDFNCDGEVDLLDFEIFRDIYVEYL